MAKVSIIIANYNNQQFLQECLDSIAKQTFGNFECIVVDDGSTDNSRNIITAMAESDKRFVPLFQENQGVSIARNNGLEMALSTDAEYIAFADADDAYLPNAFQQMVDLAEGEPEIDCVMMDYVEAEQLNQIEYATSDEYYMVIFDNLTRHYGTHVRKGSVAWSTIWGKLFRRRIVEHARFVPNLHPDEDFLFIIATLKHIRKFRIGEQVAYFYRKNPMGAMNQALKKIKYWNFYTIAKWLDEYYSDFDCPESVAIAGSDYTVFIMWDTHTQEAVDVIKHLVKSKIYRPTSFVHARAKKWRKYFIANILTLGCVPKFKYKAAMAKILAGKGQ